eukprot:scaffold89432_cov67-Phaeocystis_antarctica.AAC.2
MMLFEGVDHASSHCPRVRCPEGTPGSSGTALPAPALKRTVKARTAAQDAPFEAREAVPLASCGHMPAQVIRLVRRKAHEGGDLRGWYGARQWQSAPTRRQTDRYMVEKKHAALTYDATTIQKTHSEQLGRGPHGRSIAATNTGPGRKRCRSSNPRAQARNVPVSLHAKVPGEAEGASCVLRR